MYLLDQITVYRNQNIQNLDKGLKKVDTQIDIIKEKISKLEDVFQRNHKYEKIVIDEKYPEYIPWDLNYDQHNFKSIKWMLTKADNVYTFTRSRIDDKYVYIQRNDGKRKAFKEYEARFTYQRLFDDGYSLVAVS